MLSPTNSKLIDNFSDRESLYAWVMFGNPKLKTISTPNNIEQINSMIKSHLNGLHDSDKIFEQTITAMNHYLIDKTTESRLKEKNLHVILGLIYAISLEYNFKISPIKNFEETDQSFNYSENNNQTISNIINSQPIFKKDALTYLLSMIDLIPTTNFTKKLYIDKYISKTDSYFEETYKYKDWIKKENEVQIEWSQKYLFKHQKLINISNQFYKNHNYDLVLASIEHLIYSLPYSDLQLFIDKMKKSWSQEKYRKSDHNRKRYHMPLIPKAKKQLDELAALRNMHTHHLLEEIIEREYEQSMPKSNNFLFDKRKI